MHTTFTAGEFLKRLAEGPLRTPLIREGFAKPVEGRHEAFLFLLGDVLRRLDGDPRRGHREGGLPRGTLVPRPHASPDSKKITSRNHRRTSGSRPSSPTCFGPRTAGPVISNVTGLPISTFIGSPFIGEWMARLFADAAWYALVGGGGGGGGGGGYSGRHGRRRYCSDLRKSCARGVKKACDQTDSGGVGKEVPLNVPSLHAAGPDRRGPTGRRSMSSSPFLPVDQLNRVPPMIFGVIRWKGSVGDPVGRPLWRVRYPCRGAHGHAIPRCRRTRRTDPRYRHLEGRLGFPIMPGDSRPRPGACDEFQGYRIEL